MNKNIVSVRIPKALVKELKETCMKDHFLDVSEAVRSIVRSKWLQQKDPLSYQLKELKKDISSNIEQKKQEELIGILQQIRDQLLKNE